MPSGPLKGVLSGDMMQGGIGSWGGDLHGARNVSSMCGCAGCRMQYVLYCRCTVLECAGVCWSVLECAGMRERHNDVCPSLTLDLPNTSWPLPRHRICTFCNKQHPRVTA